YEDVVQTNSRYGLRLEQVGRESRQGIATIHLSQGRAIRLSHEGHGLPAGGLGKIASDYLERHAPLLINPAHEVHRLLDSCLTTGVSMMQLNADKVKRLTTGARSAGGKLDVDTQSHLIINPQRQGIVIDNRQARHDSNRFCKSV